MEKSGNQYEVLSPWAEADPVPLHGIVPRLENLEGKRIGLFCNSKPTSKRIMSIVSEKLNSRFPTSKISSYEASEFFWTTQAAGQNKAKFEDWLKGVDTVLAAVAD